MMLEQAATQVEAVKQGQQAMAAAQQAMTAGVVAPKEAAAGGRPAAGGGKAAQLIAAAAKKFQARAFDPILKWRFGSEPFDRGFWGQLDVALVQSPTSVAAMSGSCGVVEAEGPRKGGQYTQSPRSASGLCCTTDLQRHGARLLRAGGRASSSHLHDACLDRVDGAAGGQSGDRGI